MIAEPDEAVVRSSTRLVAYGVLGLAGLVLAVVAAEPAAAVASAPLLVLAVLGAVLPAPSPPSVTVALAPERALETDDLSLSVTVGPSHGRVDVMLALSGPLAPPGTSDPVVAWSIAPAGGSRRADLHPASWGLVTAGPVTVRTHGPFGLVHRTLTLPELGTARVLPGRQRLRQIIDPPPRAAAGTHVSRVRGGGSEFADLRASRPGDRLRDVNWRASARHRRAGRGLLVNDRLADRGGDVVVLLDAFAATPEGGSLGLDRIARATWAVADAHLRVHDRVGLVAYGAYPWWLRASSGDRARYALLDRLLTLEASWTDAPRSIRALPGIALPPAALVVGITSLHDTRTVDGLVELRRRGRDAVALVVRVADRLPEPGGDDDRTARRLWGLALDERLARLEDGGVPAIIWDGTSPVAPAVAALGRRRRAPLVVR